MAGSTSPWHAGEISMQQRLGVHGRMREVGSRVVRDFMPDQHRTFYGQLPFMLLGSVDDHGAVWAGLLHGRPGFATSPDPQSLKFRTARSTDDPALASLSTGSSVGMLGIELHTRRRNRVNGVVTDMSPDSLGVRVEHAFGNCPQYIQLRDTEVVVAATSTMQGTINSGALDEAARMIIAAADTFFVASYVDPDGDSTRRQVDVSHRGGKPGFVRIEGDQLTIPDFAGNLHFNTLGNLLVNPRAGLLFIDFDSGDVLHVTGTTEICFDGPEVAAFQGAERIWKFRVTGMVRRSGALPFQWKLREISPNSLLTGSWEQAAASQQAAALGDVWRPFRVTRIVDETHAIRSFYLQPADGHARPAYIAGQHIPIRIKPQSGDAQVIRTYTLSSAPADDDLRISVKREGLVSNWLHDHVRPGDHLECRTPRGAFVVDTTTKRPLVLLGAGVGMTPLISMLRHLVWEGRRTRGMRPTWLVQAARTAHSRPFDNEIHALAEIAGDALSISRVLSVPGDESAGSRTHEGTGRVSIELLKDLLPFDDYDFMICGPGAFVQALYDDLRDMRIADDRIHTEAFGPSTLQRRFDVSPATVVTQASTVAVPVRFLRSQVDTRWEPGSTTLLELAEANGLTPDYSCRGGSCGTCVTRLLKGKVRHMLSGVEVESTGDVLICSMQPAANGIHDSIELDL